MKQRFLLTIMLWLSLLGTTWAQNNALHFDGTNDYVACPAINPTSFTLSAWVYPTMLGKDQAIISTLSESAMTGMELHIGADNIPVLTIRSGSNWVDVKGITAVPADAWTHIAATCSGSSVYLYINGKKDKGASIDDGYTPGTQTLCLGRRSGASAFYFSGKIDEASIWSRSLSELLISTIYERDIAGTETGLMAYYKFDQGTADGDNIGITSLADATVNAQNGTLTNFALTNSTSNWVSGYTAPVHSTVAVTPPALGDGTSANPYQIATLENLYWLSQNRSVWTSKYFIQTADIDLAPISNWMPIGAGFVPFRGTYDGAGHTIRNLNINSPLVYRGLFGDAEHGSILKNLTLENANVTTTGNYASILAAYSRGIISNCHTKGGTLTAGRFVGGMCGYGIATIEDCSNSASVVSSDGIVGGITGELLNGIIRRCGNFGTINSTGGFIGGIVGHTITGTTVSANSTISDCYNTANISLRAYAGGIIGYSSSVNMYRCYSVGEVSGDWGGGASGGLVGWCNADYYHNISNSYCLQSPAIGYYATDKYTNLTNVSTKTASDLQTQSTFSGWDFVNETANGTTDSWAVTTGFNGGYPTLGNFAATCTNGEVDFSQQPASNVYTWYKINGTKLTEGVDYIVDGGITKFIKLPGSKVYCTVTNASFPTWLARTNTVTVDKITEPNITFVSERSDYLKFDLGVSTISKVYVDWGDGILVPFDLSPGEYKDLLTFNYATGNTIKIYNENITFLNLYILGMTALDVSNCTNLQTLHCYDNSLTSIDVSKNTNLQRLTLSRNRLTSINVSKNINLEEFICNNNSLTLLDVSSNTNLQLLFCFNNKFAFNSLPRPKYSEYSYAPQANLPATCAGGIVDLSSQLTTTDGSGNIQTTVYTWYNADGTALVKGTDYDGKDGKFYFMKQPASTVYCKMYNAAFPDLSGNDAFRTTDITVDAVLMPEITFSTQSFSGDFWIGITSTENTTIYIDKGDGERVAYSVTTSGTSINIAAYTVGNTVKIFSDKIIILSFALPYPILLDMLDVDKATSLKMLFCPNLSLNFQTLPQLKLSYTNYAYAPQRNFAATCAGGIVDLSSQLTAKDASDQTQTTVYTWYNADGTELVKGVDYEGKDGKFYFLKQPASTVYCKMYNAAFPDLSGDNAFRTTDIMVDKVLVHSITYVSENTSCGFNLEASIPGNVYFDAGDGNLQVPDINNMFIGSIGVPVKIFGDNINSIESTSWGLTNLDVSNNLGLEFLSCKDNKLTSLDVSKNTALTGLFCEENQLNFATLPQVKATYGNYIYAPQAKFPSTYINGVVDLSSQLTAKDVNDQTQTTVYTWYKTDGTALTANVDYIEENGVFTFIKMPATAVYCQMYNAAFPNLSGEKAFRTVDITVDAVLEPSTTFVSENTDDLSFWVSLETNSKIYVDWGTGVLESFDGSTSLTSIATTSYTMGNTVKIFGANISHLDFYGRALSALDVSKNTALGVLYCCNNNLSTLDLSKNTALNIICAYSNNFSFASLPQRQPTYINYDYPPQADLVATCTNGVVDLSSQLTAVDVNGNTQTTAYSWFLADGTPLTAGTDYIEEAGVFRFVKMPAQAVYCTMTNAAFPALTLRTVDITVDAVAEPNITLVSENNGDLRIDLDVSETSTIYVDWGNGVLESKLFLYNSSDCEFSTSTYVANNTVKIYGKSINSINALSKGLTSLNVSNASELIQLACSENKLTSLDVSKNTLLDYLQINDNRFSFATLPQSKASYTSGYWYYPQANLPATCTNGVVDLSSQLTATDIDGNLQTTSYTCFNADNTALTEGVDYMVNQGKIYFLTVPTSDVYCEMTNPAFPNLTLRTVGFTVDMPATLPEPDLTFTSEKDGNLAFSIASNSMNYRTAYIDWGDGKIVPYLFFNSLSTISTTSYVAGQTVKIYADDIRQFMAVAQGITNLDVSKCTTMTELNCSQNSLTALNVANNTELTRLECSVNNLGSLNVETNNKLQYLSCHTNASLSELNLSNNTALSYLSASGCALSSMDVSYNTALTELYLAENQIATLDVRQHTALTQLNCQNNKLTTLDVSQNTLLTTLFVDENLMNFASLPKPKASFMSDYRYAPQANIAATCTNGIVDLSSQLTAVDVDGNTQTTVYSWYLADGTALTNNYMPENGVFRFVLEPGTVVYCEMTNDAFIGLTLRTENITIDAKATLPEPTISFVSETSGSLNISVDVAENGTVYIDWGNGSLVSNQATAASMNEVSTAHYVANSSVKVYNSQLVGFYADTQGLTAINTQNAPELVTLECRENKLEEIDLSNNVKLSKLKLYQNKLDNLDVSLLKELKDLSCSRNNLSTLDIQYNTKLEWLYCEFNNLSTLDISNNPELDELFCYNNKLTISSLPQVDFSTFSYAPQANLLATCTNGIVDLSSQLTAIDKEGTTQTTVYTWYKTGNSSSLHKGTDYVEYNGVFRFLQQPDTTVYCQMKNAAFPSLTLGTEPIAIDDVVKPAITLVSEMSGELDLTLSAIENSTVYVDWGDGNLIANNLLELQALRISTPNYSASSTVKIFGTSIVILAVEASGLTDLNVSQCASLNTLYCENNMLTSLDLTQNANLQTIDCSGNSLDFVSLPKPSTSYFHYVFAPQANLNVTCSNGMVDLSAQRTAIDANGTTQTTVYTWYRLSGTELIKDTHYLELNGVFIFTNMPSEQVYCTLTNAAFPDLTLRTENITVDAVAPERNLWHGAVDTDWHTAGNWSNGVPSTIDYIEISSTASNQPVISSSVNASFLSIESEAKVTIAHTGSLRVYESLINNSGTEGLVIKSDATGTGKLIYDKAGVLATVEQYIVKDQWHYITSPVVEALNVNPLFKNFYAVSHTEAQSEGNNNGNCWNYLYTGDQIVAGTGYGVQYNRKDSDNDTIVTFRGELVGPEYVIATKHTGANFGWNLVGNPYPCTISWTHTQKGNIQDAVYVYDPATSNYMSYVNGLGSNGGSEFLAPMQGFFVRAKSPNATLNINHDSKRENESLFKGATMQSLIRLSATDAEGRKDESLVRLEPAATAQFDDAFDAYKLKATASATPQLYSVFNGDEYSINSIPEVSEQTVVPFELMIKTSGQHKLSLTELNAFNYPLVLLNGSNQIVAHLESEDYIFTAEAGETVKLFLAFSTAVSVNETLQQNMFAIGMEQQIYVGRMGLVASEVMVYNINGQVVYHQRHVEANELTIPVNKQGVYMVKVQPEKGKAYIQKVLVK